MIYITSKSTITQIRTQNEAIIQTMNYNGTYKIIVNTN